MAFDDWDHSGRFHPPSRPRTASGGIKAASQRGGFGQSWWGRRWIQVLESFDISSRLQRGRTYARKGQVLSIEVAGGLVTAAVQGSRHDPYRVSIKVRPLKTEEWKLLTTRLSQQVIYGAKLLAGEMPLDIERVFTEAGLSLFPQKVNELSTNCSCPDWSNPCKHVAAVYYLLGEEFDRDPFLIFRLRGMGREEFIAELGSLQFTGEPPAIQHLESEPLPPQPPAADPLPVDPHEFWNAKTEPADLLGDLTLKRPVAALPHRLGNFQFWRGESPLIKSLEPSYESAVRKAEQILLGEKGSPE